MTGLNIEEDQIIEMACIITDSDLNILAEGPNLIINQPDELLDGMSEWCKEHHGKVRYKRGYIFRCHQRFCFFFLLSCPMISPPAGNSVHADKRFLDKHMPQFMHHLHYRIIDVSTIKELCRSNTVISLFFSFRALGDIQESIKELQYYQANIFKATLKEKKHMLVENGNSNKM
uniref:Exonuclease domain-containing protein n=1 Tax=Scophthalmus maximus TaxID=52904 RepID=A0A8D3D2A2_SCOMX